MNLIAKFISFGRKNSAPPDSVIATLARRLEPSSAGIGETVWLIDRKRENEIFCVCDGEKISALRIRILAHYFEFDQKRGLRYAILSSASAGIVRMSPEMPEDAISIAREFVANVEGASNLLRQRIENEFKSCIKQGENGDEIQHKLT